MARAAKSRGYRFMCITDHSHYLRDGCLEAEWREIGALNEQLTSFRLLRGIEVQHPPARVDVDDGGLGELDWVVALLHTSFDRSPTERIMGTMDNPHVDCILGT